MEDPEISATEEIYDSLVNYSTQLALLVAEHSQTGYKHQDFPLPLQDLGYTDEEVEDRLNELETGGHLENNSDPFTQITVLLDQARESVDRIDPRNPVYIESEHFYKALETHSQLTQLRNHLYNSNLIEEAINTIGDNDHSRHSTGHQTHELRQYDRPNFQIPDEQHVTQTDENRLTPRTLENT